MLDGATALAIPTAKGQSLTVEELDKKLLDWKSYDHEGNCWFHIECLIKKGRLITLRLRIGSAALEEVLLNILETAISLNPLFLTKHGGYRVTTQLNFPRTWGLGTSSTLINNIAQWAQVDPFALLSGSFGGSGYDIAAAQSEFPILYSVHDEDSRVEHTTLEWPFKESIFFVHLNQKQDSKEGIARYRKFTSTKTVGISVFSEISRKITRCTSLKTFSTLLEQHEQLISNIIEIPTIKERLFPDYPKTIKSLGAWGGDFVLVVGDISDQEYFRRKNYTTIIPFKDMIK